MITSDIAARPRAIVFVILAAVGCGRTAIGTPPPLETAADDETAADEMSAGNETAPAEESTGDAQRPPETFFFEDFEDEDALEGWEFDELWSVETLTGDGANDSLRGSWRDFDVGCSVTAFARSPPIDLSEEDLVLEFMHRGSVCAYDVLILEIEINGETSGLPVPIPDSNEWTPYSLRLPPWTRAPDARILVGFMNVCGDSCGVDWAIDDLTIYPDED